MPRAKPKRKAAREPMHEDERARRAHLAELRRTAARARRDRGLIKQLDRDHRRLQADLETFAMSVLHDSGFVVVGKKEHDALINDNIELRQAADRLERELATALGVQPAPAV